MTSWHKSLPETRGKTVNSVVIIIKTTDKYRTVELSNGESWVDIGSKGWEL